VIFFSAGGVTGGAAVSLSGAAGVAPSVPVPAAGRMTISSDCDGMVSAPLSPQPLAASVRPNAAAAIRTGRDRTG
jgi:hypothetical protein